MPPHPPLTHRSSLLFIDLVGAGASSLVVESSNQPTHDSGLRNALEFCRRGRMSELAHRAESSTRLPTTADFEQAAGGFVRLAVEHF